MLRRACRWRGWMMAGLGLGVAAPLACGGRSLPDDDFARLDEAGSAATGGTRFAPATGGSAFAGAGGSALAGSGGVGAGGTRANVAGASGAGGGAIAGAAGAGGAPIGAAGSGGSAGNDRPLPSIAFTGCNLSTPLADGLAVCENGVVHRPFRGVTCANALPRERAFAPEVLLELEQLALQSGLSEQEVAALYACREDTDCTELPDGYCELAEPAGRTGAPFTACRYACRSDADCGGGTLCACGVPGGRCQTAFCLEDGECGEGLRCARYDASPACEYESPVWRCQQRDDECSLDTHCAIGQACLHRDGRRRCTTSSCVGP